MATTTGRPGTFVTEILTPLSMTASAPPTQAVAAFVGTHNAGPVGPALISSWSDWKSSFGDFGNGTDLLPYAVYEYFANGGGQAYIVRAVPADAVTASVVLNDLGTGGTGGTTPEPVLTLTAIAPGSIGNSLYIDIVAGATGSGRFNLILRQGSATGAPAEQYTDVSLNPNDPRNLVAMIGASSTAGSKYLTAIYNGSNTWDYRYTPATQTGTPLTGGLDGTATVNLVTATELLDSVDAILNINLPGVSDPTVLNPLITWAENSGDRFLVVDGPQAATTGYADTVNNLSNLSPNGSPTGTPLTSSSYVAVYGPWLTFRDPSAQAAGATRLLPPGGAMLGLYSTADNASGTQQTAAGVSFPIRGALSAQTRFTDADLDTLNSIGINIIRTVPGASGVVPMGARTLKVGMPDRYIAIRRTLMYLRRLCIDMTQFANFRPNNEDLWMQITSILTDQLSALQQDGVLRGATAAEAFYVVCDDTNNTANSVANGIVNIEIGISLNTPAEYIVIQIGQIATGATSTDSLSS